MEATVLRFLAFLGAEFFFIVASAAVLLSVGLLVGKSGQIKGQHILAAGAVNGIVSMLFLTLILRILTGQWYASFFLSTLAASLVLTGLAELLWLIFGEPNVPWAARVIWHKREFEKLFPVVTRLVQVIAFVVLIIYPIYIGMGYFGEAFESRQWHGYVLRATLVLIVGSSFLLVLPGSLYVMMCRNIAEGTRSRIFITQLAGSVVVLMIVSFFVWTLEPDATSVPLVGKLVAFTPIVLYTTIGYVIVLLVIPYLIGHFRHKAWAAKLDGESSGIMNGLQVGVRSPLFDTAKEALVEAVNEIDESLDELAKDRSYRLTKEVSSHTNAEYPFFVNAARKSVQHDPRFIHAKLLMGLRRQISDCLSVIASTPTDKEKRNLLDNFTDAIDQRTESQTQADADRPLVLSGITFIVLAITNPIITALIKVAASEYGLSFD